MWTMIATLALLLNPHPMGPGAARHHVPAEPDPPQTAKPFGMEGIKDVRGWHRSP